MPARAFILLGVCGAHLPSRSENSGWRSSRAFESSFSRPGDQTEVGLGFVDQVPKLMPYHADVTPRT